MTVSTNVDEHRRVAINCCTDCNGHSKHTCCPHNNKESISIVGLVTAAAVWNVILVLGYLVLKNNFIH